MRYHSLADVTRLIAGTLGESVHEFDLNGIIEEAYRYAVDKDEDGKLILTSAGWEPIVDAEQWWEIAERHNVCDRVTDQAGELLRELGVRNAKAMAELIEIDDSGTPAERWHAALSTRLGSTYDADATRSLHDSGAPKLSFVAHGHVFTFDRDSQTWTFAR